ncbi:MAG: hypothetical protein ACHQT8_04965 [Chlamydiales bacterium]
MNSVKASPAAPFTANVVHKPLESKGKENVSWVLADWLKWMVFSALSSLNPKWSITQAAKEELNALKIKYDFLTPKAVLDVKHAVECLRHAQESAKAGSEAAITAQKSAVKAVENLVNAVAACVPDQDMQPKTEDKYLEEIMTRLANRARRQIAILAAQGSPNSEIRVNPAIKAAADKKRKTLENEVDQLIKETPLGPKTAQDPDLMKAIRACAPATPSDTEELP